YAPPMQAGEFVTSHYAIYAGKDDRYHYLDVGWPNISPCAFRRMFFTVSFTEETLRCRFEALPDDFPEGFETINQELRRSRQVFAYCEGLGTINQEPRRPSQSLPHWPELRRYAEKYVRD
ncbi:MAG: hypothetical protein QGD94_12320, partial [Planctomycetia bacterium]|nr:hypothetical protein [Planctomycetia bacterium]